MTQGTNVTIVVVPRERFSFALASLDSLLANTARPFELVYVDGNSPRRVRRALERAAHRESFRLVRRERYLSPSEARNIGLAEVATEFVVFVDNDVLFTPGWLETLVGRAAETGAWVCGPLILFGDPSAGAIHAAGSDVSVAGPAGRRRISEEHTLMGRWVADVADELYAKPCDSVESHCILVRRDVFDRLGPWDEKLLGLEEHIDLCLAVRAAGGLVYVEPASVVSYVAPPPLALSDVPFFLLRWSDAWVEATFRHFQEKWDLDPHDPGFDSTLQFCRHHRRLFLRRTRRAYHAALGRHGARLKNGLLLPAERAVTRAAVRVTRLVRGNGR